MLTNVLMEKSVKPNNEQLSGVLGKTYKLWEDLKKHLIEEHGELIEDWKFYNQKSGWTLKLLKKKRNLFFFIALEKCFRIVFVFGDKAVAEVEKSDLAESIKEELRNAKKYAEGRGLPLDVKTRKDVENVKKLVRIKLKN